MIPQIRSTTDYSKFHKKRNRLVKPANLRKVRKQIEELDLTRYFPIVIGAKGEIKDGQHRYEACKELGLPIWYVTLSSEDEPKTKAEHYKMMTSLNNTGSKNSTSDFIEIAIKNNITEAKKAMKIAKSFREEEEFLIPIATVFKMLHKFDAKETKELNGSLKNGTYKVNERNVPKIRAILSLRDRFEGSDTTVNSANLLSVLTFYHTHEKERYRLLKSDIENMGIRLAPETVGKRSNFESLKDYLDRKISIYKRKMSK